MGYNGTKEVAEEQKQKEQIRYRNILNMLEIAFIEVSEVDGLYSSEKYHEYALSDYDLNSVVENGCEVECVYPDDLPILLKFFDGKKDAKGHNSATLRLKMKDGSYRWTEMIAFTHYDNPDTKTGKRITGIFRDVENSWMEQKQELQHALENAEEANNAKTDFLSRVSHDMRTPLNGILGITKLMRDYLTEDAALKDLEQLEMSGRYLLNLINDTLDVSKIESGNLQLHPVVCDGRTVFNNVLQLIKPNMEQKHISFQVYADNLPFTILYMDVGRIEQIIMNLLGNAIKFTPDGETIIFTMKNISVENGIILDEVTVEDNGIGMSEEFIPLIFDPFTQEDSGRTSSQNGTGLGMTITKEIIELMGGKISVTSKKGKGSTFKFTLPMQIATDEQIAEWKNTIKEEKHNHSLNGIRVLLCEDHPLNVAIATRSLEKKGVIVEHAENGEIGVQMFNDSKRGYYQAILMDIRMPVMDGIDATKAIRKLERPDATQIPIIAMTANVFEEDVKTTREAGMNEHLGKPVEPEKLYEVLEELTNVEINIKKDCILIVDDLEVNRKVIISSIHDDYEIMQASNGEEALAILEQNPGISAVITDIQMPIMDGLELIRRMRANSSYAHIAIIANTQYGEYGQEEKLLEMGANDFIYKPNTPKIIEIRLNNALRKM